MSAPNIVNVTSIYGVTNVQAIGTSPTAIVNNPGSSNQVLKINSLLVSNVDGTNSATLTVDLYRNGTATHLIKAVTINPNTTFSPVDKNVTLYLQEGDSLRLTASASGDLEAICSYEEIT